MLVQQSLSHQLSGAGRQGEVASKPRPLLSNLHRGALTRPLHLSVARCAPGSADQQHQTDYVTLPAQSIVSRQPYGTHLGQQQTASSQNGNSSAHPSTNLLSITALALAGLGAASFGPSPLSAQLQQPLFVLQALGVLTAIVAVHEAGHFIAARLQGIHVTKFAIGFGPPLWTYKPGEVEYSLRTFPLGGYVAFPDDDPESPYPKDDPDLLRNRSIPERAAVISAGVIANIIFAYTVLLLQAGTVGKAESAYLPGVRMPEVTIDSAASRAGFQDGDVITRVRASDLDLAVPASPTSVPQVVSAIRTHPGEKLTFTVERKGAPALVDVEAVPEPGPNGQGRIGVRLSANTYIGHVKASGPAEAVSIANAEFIRLSTTVLNGLKAIFTNFTGVAGQLSGPVAIVAAGSEIAKTDSAGLFQFCAIVNINLALVNVLPLPALDGGYLLLLAVEAARGGKKLPQKVEQGFMASGFLLLMAAGIGLVVKDTLGLLPLGTMLLGGGL